MSEVEADMVKIILEGRDGTETLWAERLPNGHFQMDNAPFFYYGVSADDVVEATPDPDYEFFYRFVRVVERSGNFTIRIYSEHVDIESAAFAPICEKLQAFGCSYEGFPPRLLAVTIPPSSNKDEIWVFLNDQDLMWEYGNPTYAEQFGTDDA